MAKDIEIGVKVNGLAAVKSELKALKGELVNATDPAEIERLSKAAGQLSDKIADANEKIKVFAGGSDFEKVSNGLGLVGNQLKSLDFEGAAESAKLLTGTIKSMNPKQVADGFKAFASTIGQLGNAFFQMGLKLLANPIFLLVAVVVAVIAAIVLLKDKVKILGDVFDFFAGIVKLVIQGLKDLTDAIGLTSFAEDAATEKYIENSKKRSEASKKATDSIVDDLTRQLNELKAQGKDTEKIELQIAATKAQAAAKNLRDLEADRKKLKADEKATSDSDLKEKIKTRQAEITEEKEANKKAYKDANSEYRVIQLTNDKQEAEDAKKAAEEKAKKAKEYAAMRIQVERQLQDLYLNAQEEGLIKDLSKNQAAYDRKVQDTINNEKLLASERIRLIAAFQIEKEAADKLAYEKDKKLQDEARKKAKEDALKLQADMKKIREDFDNFIINETGTSLEKELNESKNKYNIQKDALKKALDDRLITQAEYNNKVLELNNVQAVAIDKIRKDNAEKDKKSDEELYKAKIDTILKFFDASQALLGSVGALLNQGDNQRLNDIQTQSDAESQLLEERRNNELSQTNLSEAQKDSINKKYNQLKYKNELEAFKKSEEIKKRQFDRDKALRMVNIVMDTAAGVMRGYGEVGPIAGAILAGLTIATGAIQLATVASQKYQGAAGPSAPSLGGGGSGGTSEAITPTFALSGNRNQGSMGEAAQAAEANRNQNLNVTLRISETEITDTQNRVRRIERSAEL